jgi:4-hydroxy-tetrahydrodipicolinate reductase
LGADVVIEFTTASAIEPLFKECAKKGVALVSGTTNLGDAGQAALEDAVKKIPVVWAPNMSRGVQVLAECVRHAVSRLGLDFDVEIVEVHHRRKIDSPSGTAVRLAEAAREARPELTQIRGRDGEVGARTDEEMAVFGVRGGDVIGDHTVHLLGDSERLELTHRATNRDLFARGAISAARFALSKDPGRYTIADVLGG